MAFDQVKQAEFLTAVMNGSTIKEACEKIGVPRRTYYAFRKEHPAFDSAVEDAKEAGVDHLISEARTRALDREDPKSATLLIFLIKGMRPEYKENYKPEPKTVSKPSTELDFTAAEAEAAMAILDKAKNSLPQEEETTP